jgi:proline racemase
MPTRVITGGVPALPGATMLERKLRFEAERDDLRLLLMREPRGHGAMSARSCSRRCGPTPTGACCSSRSRLPADVRARDDRRGHRARGDGMVAVAEPETSSGSTRRPGLVEARVRVEGGRATAVTLRNVASFLHERDATVDVPGLGPVAYDLAFGGNFYALVDAASVGLAPEPERAQELVDAGAAVMAAIDAAGAPVHPEDERIRGCHHVVFHAPGSDGAHARAATSIHPGWLDRSPCGTGTSARLAQLHARGELATGEAFVNESVIGTRFTGRVVEETTVAGRPAVVPEVTGRAWITGMGQYLLDPTDPFPAGFRLG